jgi:hypothetical protein
MIGFVVRRVEFQQVQLAVDGIDESGLFRHLQKHADASVDGAALAAVDLLTNVRAPNTWGPRKPRLDPSLAPSELLS